MTRIDSTVWSSVWITITFGSSDGSPAGAAVTPDSAIPSAAVPAANAATPLLTTPRFTSLPPWFAPLPSEHSVRRRVAVAAETQPFRTSTAIWAASVGEVPTRTPLASSASFFACAVPDEPEMIAPAWPICLPGGAVKPAM